METACFLCGPSCNIISEGQSCHFSWVLQGRLWRQDLSVWSWRISTLRSCCLGTDGENTAGWKRLSECCDELWIVETNGVLYLLVASSRVYKWSINPFTNPNPVYSHTHVTIYLKFFPNNRSRSVKFRHRNKKLAVIWKNSSRLISP
jgi:hypothetical protein